MKHLRKLEPSDTGLLSTRRRAVPSSNGAPAARQHRYVSCTAGFQPAPNEMEKRKSAGNSPASVLEAPFSNGAPAGGTLDLIATFPNAKPVKIVNIGDLVDSDHV